MMGEEWNSKGKARTGNEPPSDGLAMMRKAMESICRDRAEKNRTAAEWRRADL